MSDWKKGLDRWLTTPPDNNDGWYEEVVNSISDDDWNDEIEEWLSSAEGIKAVDDIDPDGKLTPKEAAARIVEIFKKRLA